MSSNFVGKVSGRWLYTGKLPSRVARFSFLTGFHYAAFIFVLLLTFFFPSSSFEVDDSYEPLIFLFSAEGGEGETCVHVQVRENVFPQRWRKTNERVCQWRPLNFARWCKRWWWDTPALICSGSGYFRWQILCSSFESSDQYWLDWFELLSDTRSNLLMSTKTKRVTYEDPEEDNADYLVPLQYDLRSTRVPASRKASTPASYFGSIYQLVALLLYLGVPVSQLVIGSIYVGQCTVQPFIPIYMILTGIFGILYVLVGLLLFWQLRRQASLASYADAQKSASIGKLFKPIFIFLFLINIGWFITGQVIVLQVKFRVELNYPTLPEYCHATLYKAAYVLLFVTYLLVLIVVILIIIRRITVSSDTKTPPKPVPPRPQPKWQQRRSLLSSVAFPAEISMYYFFFADLLVFANDEQILNKNNIHRDVRAINAELVRRHDVKAICKRPLPVRSRESTMTSSSSLNERTNGWMRHFPANRRIEQQQKKKKEKKQVTCCHTQLIITCALFVEESFVLIIVIATIFFLLFLHIRWLMIECPIDEICVHSLAQLSVVFVSFALSSLVYCSLRRRQFFLPFSLVDNHNGIVVCIVLCKGQGTKVADHKNVERRCSSSLLFRPFVPRRNSNRVREVPSRLFYRNLLFAGTLRYSLHKQASASLKSGLDLKEIVRLPDNEDEDDWIAVHGETGVALRDLSSLPSSIFSGGLFQSNQSGLWHHQWLLHSRELSDHVRWSALRV